MAAYAAGGRRRPSWPAACVRASDGRRRSLRGGRRRSPPPPRHSVVLTIGVDRVDGAAAASRCGRHRSLRAATSGRCRSWQRLVVIAIVVVVVGGTAAGPGRWLRSRRARTSASLPASTATPVGRMQPLIEQSADSRRFPPNYPKILKTEHTAFLFARIWQITKAEG